MIFRRVTWNAGTELLIWRLDAELVRAESEACRQAIEASRKSSTWTSIDLVSRIYRGRFALDFEYEEWSANYRDNLHASYLGVIKAALISDELRPHPLRATNSALQARPRHRRDQ